MRLVRGSSGRVRAAALGAVAIALAVVASSSGAPPALKQKEAEAQQVLAEVQALDGRLESAVEAWNGARYRLGKLRVQEQRNAAALVIARRQFRLAQQRAAARLVALYESNEPSTTEAVLGAASVSDILDRIELVNASAELDHQIAHRLAQTRDTLAHRGAQLANERRKQAQAVAELAAKRTTIEAGLTQRRALLASVQGEVRTLQAQERQLQARLAAEARARLQAEQQRLAQERAALAAQRAKATRPVAPTTATTTTTPPTTTTAATTTTMTAAPPAPPSSLPAGHPEAATIALRYLGVPYLWGGSSPATGFDCSGLVMYVYAQLGIALPHFAAAQYGYGAPVSRDQLQPGDLVFFDNLDHVAIWIGGGQFVHAPHTGDVVKIESLSGNYASGFVGARRI